MSIDSVLETPRKIFWKTVWEIRGKKPDPVDARGGLGTNHEELDNSVRHIANTLRVEPHDTVLDVGCNVGYMMNRFAPSVSHITGVDISATAVAQGKEALAHHSNVDVFQSEAAKIAKPSNAFSKIYCYSVIIHFPYKSYWRLFLGEVKRLLKPGGVALIGDIPNKGTFDFDTMKRYNVIRKIYMFPITIGIDLILQARYTRAEVVADAKAVGLNVEFLKQPPGLPFYASRFDILLTHAS
jgi:cyclopropane fatty-acyl-phospholipid synthase-like methyltransferase